MQNFSFRLISVLLAGGCDHHHHHVCNVTTPQDPSFQTVLTWRHQRLGIFRLYGTIQMLLLLSSTSFSLMTSWQAQPITIQNT